MGQGRICTAVQVFNLDHKGIISGIVQSHYLPLLCTAASLRPTHGVLTPRPAAANWPTRRAPRPDPCRCRGLRNRVGAGIRGFGRPAASGAGDFFSRPTVQFGFISVVLHSPEQIEIEFAWIGMEVNGEVLVWTALWHIYVFKYNLMFNDCEMQKVPKLITKWIYFGHCPSSVQNCKLNHLVTTAPEYVDNS